MTSDVKTPDLLGDTIRDAARDASTASWWLVALGALWIWFGMFVLSYKVGSLVAVATLVGTAFVFGGITQLAVASRVPTLRWLSIVSGTLGVAAGIVTIGWPGVTLYAVSILVAWFGHRIYRSGRPFLRLPRDSSAVSQVMAARTNHQSSRAPVARPGPAATP